MSTAIIFAIGLFVSGITFVAVVLVGLSEAADPKLSRPSDLTEWEWSMVREARMNKVAENEEAVTSVPVHE